MEDPFQDPQDPKKSGFASQLAAASEASRAGHQVTPVEADPERDAIRNELMRVLEVSSYMKSQEARGLGEHLKYGAGAMLKGAADGLAHLGSLAFKVAGAANLPMGGTKGYETHGQILKQLVGTDSPGAMDYLTALTGNTSINVYDPVKQTVVPMSAGAATDEMLRRKIGNLAIGAEVAGNVASFALGPGAALGRGGATAIQPLAGIVERGIAKTLLRRSGQVSDEGIRTLLDQGRGMEILAQNPAWRTNFTLLDRTLEAGGRNVRDLMGMAAGNMAQAYGLMPDDQRLDGAKFALLTAPMALPLVKLGEKIASRALTYGLKPDELRTVGETYKRVLQGGMTPSDAAKHLNQSIGSVRRFGSDVISGMFEGTAFMGLDPSAHKLFDQWLDGDQEAGAQLAAMAFGSMVGVAGLKYGVGFDQHHMFRTIRPDLNRIQTKIEAESIRRAQQEAKKAKAAPQEPQQPGGLVRGAKAEIELERQFDLGKHTQAEQRAAEALAAQRKAGQREGPQDEGQGGEPTQQGEDVSGVLDRVQQDVNRTYDWADHPTLGVMRAMHQEPTLHRDGSIQFQFSRDYGIDVRSEGGQLVVEFDPQKMLPMLKDAGREQKNYEVLAPTRVRVSGKDAERLLDDIALIQMQQTMQGDLDFSRMGMHQADGRPDLWEAPQGGAEYFQKQMDGSTIVSDKLGDGVQKVDLAVVEGWDEPKHPLTPAAAALLSAIQHKHALAPDPVIDGVIGRAITMSLHSDSLGAEQLRQFFATADPNQIVAMLRPETDQILAFQLGSLGIATNNAQHASIETPRMLEAATAKPDYSDYERAIAQDLAGAEGKPVDAPEAQVAQEPEAPQPKPVPTIPDMIEPPKKGEEINPESGSVIDVGGELGRGIGEELSGLRGRGRRALEVARRLTERMPELLRGKGDDAYVDRIRQTIPQKYLKVGELQTMSKLAEKALRKAGRSFRNETIETDGGPMPIAQAAWEGRDIGRKLTEREQQAVDLVQQVFRRAYEMQKEAGSVRHVFDPESGETKVQPFGTPKKIRTPRFLGPDWSDVMGQKDQRMRLMEQLIDKNNLQTKDPETGEMRRMRVEELDAEMKKDAAAAKLDVPGRQSAAEFQREIQWFPSVFEGKKILETDPNEILRRLIYQQGGRAASVAEFGPTMTPAQRKQLKEDYGIEYPESRQGVQKHLEDFIGTVETRTPEGQYTADLARRLVTDIEGGTPEQWQMRDARRFLHAIDAPRRAALTALSFLADPGDAFMNRAMFFGRAGKTMKLLANMAMHPIQSAKAMYDAKVHAERVGTLLRGIGQRDVMEASSWWQKWVDAVSWTGNQVEAFKTAYFTNMAETMMADWGQGKVTSQDRWLVNRVMRFSPEQQRALLGGEADPKLQATFRREFSQLAVSRRPLGEGSAFSASPNARAFLAFTNWSSGNLFKVARIYHAAGQDMLQGVKTGDIKMVAEGVYRGLKATGLITTAGLTTKMLAYTVAGMIRNEDGLDRFWKELSYAATDPKLAAAYLGRTFVGQAAGGPLAMFVNALSSPDDPGPWAKLTTPGAIWFAISKALEKPMPTTPLELGKAIGSLALESGYVPLGSQIRSSALASATMAGSSKEGREAYRMTQNWLRMEGVDQPAFERNKPDAFYDAMAGVRRAIANHPDDPAAALKEAATSLRAALEIGSEQSVASTLRSYQTMAKVPKDKVDRYAEFMGEDRMNQVYANDQAIRQFASLVGLMEGEEPQPFARELELAEGQARLGGGTLWQGLAERAVDDAAVRLEAGQDIGEDIRTLAESIAAFPEQQSWLSERQKRALTRSSQSYAARVRLVENILRQRAREKSRNVRDKARKVKRETGIDLMEFRR